MNAKPYICGAFMRATIAILFVVLFGLSACNSLEKIQKSSNTEYKLQKANEFYDKAQYAKAIVFYEELLTVFKGTKRFEDIYYKYAMSYYKQRSYLAASYHFKNFSDLFPNSKRAEEARFLHSKSLFEQAPEYTLDQANTKRTINELQNFINTHPKSNKVKDANEMIDDSRFKLELKDKYAAELYLKVSQYRAAAIYFEQIINKYPDSKFIDYYQYRILQSRYKYAKQSIETKQKERFTQVLEDYAYFKSINPKNVYQKDIESIKSLSSQTLSKLQ
jgi:outer membrane protein assembly factor BamD